MKKILFIVLFLVMSTSEVLAQPAFGLFGGLNSAGLSGDTPDKTSFGSRLGFAGGIIGEFDVADDVRLSFQPMFIQRGASIAFQVPYQEEYQDSLSANLSYISIPLMVKVATAGGRAFFSSGLEFGYLLGAELEDVNVERETEDISYLFEDIDVSVSFGFGLVFPLGTPLLTVEARYTQSLLNLSSGTNRQHEAMPLRFRSSNLQIFAGLLIPLGGSK